MFSLREFENFLQTDTKNLHSFNFYYCSKCLSFVWHKFSTWLGTWQLDHSLNLSTGCRVSSFVFCLLLHVRIPLFFLNSCSCLISCYWLKDSPFFLNHERGFYQDIASLISHWFTSNNLIHRRFMRNIWDIWINSYWVLATASYTAR